jgi:hypothetical protein
MRNVLAVLAVVLTTPTLAAPGPATADPRPAPAAGEPRIQVVFKLDPRLSGPTYGGAHWVSPPTFHGAAAQDVVEARASAVDARGRRVKGSPRWKPSDPEMVTVTPLRGDRVAIAVRRGGESQVVVALGGAARTLNVKAARVDGAWQVSISQ